MREKNTTKVLTTPWISVSVTMSPLATCESSCPRTASISSRLIDCSSPLETATSESFFDAPVANAFGAPSKIATSGMPTPARSARLLTVLTSQYSVLPSEPSIRRAPVLHFAIVFDIASEMNEPPKPMTAENTSSIWRLRPSAVRKRSTPSTLTTTDSTSITARLVTRNSTIRFMGSPAGGAELEKRYWAGSEFYHRLHSQPDGSTDTADEEDMPKLSADDKLEIQELCAAYAHLVDAGDFARFVERVFAEDGINDFADIGYPAVQGREAIRRDYARMNHPIAHLTTNTLFEHIVSADEAEVITKYFVIGADA